MKKKFLCLMLPICFALATGCGGGISQEEYNALNEKYEALLEENERLLEENEGLKAVPESDEVDLSLDHTIETYLAAADSDRLGIIAVFNTASSSISAFQGAFDLDERISSINEQYDKYKDMLEQTKAIYEMVDPTEDRYDDAMSIIDDAKVAWEKYRDNMYDVFDY